jgi:hypothetical protein
VQGLNKTKKSTMSSLFVVASLVAAATAFSTGQVGEKGTTERRTRDGWERREKEEKTIFSDFFSFFCFEDICNAKSPLFGCNDFKVRLVAMRSLWRTRFLALHVAWQHEKTQITFETWRQKK